jgi:excisionase family DNA binding protein
MVVTRISGVADDELLTEQELATLLKVAVRTVRRWRVEGSGPPALRIGRVVRYRRADVDRWLAQKGDDERRP